jgi:hypothetical protein
MSQMDFLTHFHLKMVCLKGVPLSLTLFSHLSGYKPIGQLKTLVTPSCVLTHAFTDLAIFYIYVF